MKIHGSLLPSNLRSSLSLAISSPIDTSPLPTIYEWEEDQEAGAPATLLVPPEQPGPENLLSLLRVFTSVPRSTVAPTPLLCYASSPRVVSFRVPAHKNSIGNFTTFSHDPREEKKKKTLASPTTSPMLATVALLLLLVDHCPPCECVGKRIEKYREERERGGERERMCVSMCVCVSVYAYMRVCVCVCVRLVGRVRRMEGCASANTLAWQTRSLPSGVPARLTTRD